MERVATYLWRTDPPTSVDEELALYDDGTARLVVRHARTLAPYTGTFRAMPGTADGQVLAAAGPGPLVFDLLRPPDDPVATELAAALARTREEALEQPEAVVTFHARVLRAGSGRVNMSLLAVGAGERAVEFELGPEACAVHFGAGGGTLSWVELPEPQTGFVTRSATSLGGLRSAAVVEPGAYGAISVPVTVPGGAELVSVQVGGWLLNALPDDDSPQPFEARTAEVALEDPPDAAG